MHDIDRSINDLRAKAESLQTDLDLERQYQVYAEQMKGLDEEMARRRHLDEMVTESNRICDAAEAAIAAFASGLTAACPELDLDVIVKHMTAATAAVRDLRKEPPVYDDCL